MDSEESLSRSNSLQRSEVRRRGKKSHRSGNDFFVCFTPRTSLNLPSRPSLHHSPARDGGRSRRDPVHSLSRFQKGPKKQGYEAPPEPSSPKVTCIGQVRVKQRTDGHGSSSSSSSRRSFCKWRCPKLRTDFPCFRNHGSISSFCSREGNCFFARSLLLIQDHRKTEEPIMDSHSCVRIENFKEALDLFNDVESIAKGDEENEAKEEQSCVTTEEDEPPPPPPPNALLLTRYQLKSPVPGGLMRSTSAPSQCRIEGTVTETGDRFEKERKFGHFNNNLEPKPSISVLKRSKSDSTGVVMEIRCLIENQSDQISPFVKKGYPEGLKTIFEEEKKQENEGPMCLSPQAESQEPEEEPSTNDKLEEEMENPVAPSITDRYEALKVSVDIVPETWIHQGNNSSVPLEENTDNFLMFNIQLNDLEGHETDADDKFMYLSDAKDKCICVSDSNGNSVIDTDYGSCEEKGRTCIEVERREFEQIEDDPENSSQVNESKEQDHKDNQILQDVRENGLIYQEEENLNLPDWEKCNSMKMSSPGAVFLLTYKVEALRLSVDGALETLSNAEGENHERLKVEGTLPLEDIQRLEYTRVVKERKGYSNSILEWKSRRTKMLKVPHAFRLQRCKSEPVRHAV